MILDLNKYRRVIKPLVESYITRTPDADKCEDLTLIAQSTGCHILAVGYYMGELFGFSEELKAKIGRLQTYYHEVEVINKLIPGPFECASKILNFI
jgi:hypothetical protein